MEFQVPHQILSAELATNQKWPYKSFSYIILKLKIQLTKHGHDFRKQSASNIEVFKMSITKTIRVKWYSLNCLGMSYYVNFLEGLGSNEFLMKWRLGTHGSWKKSKSWEPFWGYQLNSVVNSLAWFLGKLAKLAVLLSW